MGTLKLYGYLRGRNLSVDSLIHLPSLGTFQMSEIYELKRNGSDKIDEMWSLAQQADPKKQESLDKEAIYDDMNAEQTWPTEQELADVQIKAVKKKVPKGTSDYQAAWILDSDEEAVTDESGEDEDESDDEKENDELNEDDESGDENVDEDGSSVQDEQMETVII